MTRYPEGPLLERIESLAALRPKHAAPEPIPWAERLKGFAEGSYRLRGSQDLDRLQDTERELGAKGDPHSFYARPADLLATRALTVGTSSGGGYLTDTFNLMYAPYPQPPTQVVDLVEQIPLGAGSGAVAIPTGGSSMTPTYQGSETTSVSDSTLTTGQANATPKTLLCTVSFSRLLQLQSSPAADLVVNRELSNSLRAAISAGIVYGSGTNGQPHGVAGLAGIGTESGATIALSHLITAQNVVGDANAIFDPTRTAWVTNPDTAAILMARFTSPMVTPLWTGSLHMGEMLGTAAFSTKSVGDSTLLYGDWSTIALPIWGGVQILVDPFQGPSNSNFKQGLVSVRIAFTYDVIPRYPVSFYSLTSVS